jgi:DNA-binding NarL/FixJ family response regulator
MQQGGGVSLPLAVIDPAPSYRIGLGAVLRQGGFDPVEVPDDPMGWIAAPGCRALLLTVRSAADWEPLRRIAAAGADSIVVALVVDPTPDRHAEALRAGATAAIAWNASPDVILDVVRAAVRGYTLLPSPVARAMATGQPPKPDPDWVTPQEVEWLRLLATGITIQELAGKAGYSERAFYRVLHGLYGRMRIANRTEAILLASRWGLLEDPVDAGAYEADPPGT